ncbi:spore photoproduct lyase [Clostridium acetireducens DSM 10703]|jgi:spore photoproduct lyase|uniref:Spore photoproduct lyase n=1 Tax=Clostridium acetireducens DSM 10703 TaxID=1121290 RepID=A0A1E8F2C4_9CLOT|nr:spore photoproduct lyase [Clostridium acetireducens]OFI07784.1 spore photoproduct lyase [Clostridium acetireducens DSM 10703]
MFSPRLVLFEKGALDYELGKYIYNRFKNDSNVEIIKLSSNKIISSIPGENMYEKYRAGKKTLVVGVKKSLKFQSCKPSAHYQLPLVTGCMGQCEYCYLNTQLGNKPFVRVYANIDEILNQAKKYIQARSPEITIFEGSATSDPIPVEPYTNSLKTCIEYFAGEQLAKFRFVTKYNDIDSLLQVNHNSHTEIRFSLNTYSIINEYEHFTASAHKRIEAAAKLARHGYPIGFIIAPVFIYENWKEEYRKLIDMLHKTLPQDLKVPIGFEVISHRFTTKAKNTILEIFPETTLPMKEEERKFKYGQFGYGKYIYPNEQLQEIKNFFKEELSDKFKDAHIKYII